MNDIVIKEYDIINSRTIQIEDGEGDATLSMERRDILFTTSLQENLDRLERKTLVHKGLPTQKTPRTASYGNGPLNIIDGANYEGRCVITQQAACDQPHECLSEESKDHR